jgi:hypothetical protein
MANIYKKIFIALIATGLFIGACSKGGENNPTPTNPTPTNPNPTIPDPNPTNTTPTITSLSVTSGGFDAVVLINGTNFSTTIANNKVFFNGKAATVTAATATQLTVKVPQDAGTGAVTLSVSGGATVTGPTFTYIIPIPVQLAITSTDVDKGISGALVNITGTGFNTIATENKVFFNGKAAEVTTATTTKLSVRVPDGAGIGKLTITVNGKTVNGPEFTYYLSSTVTTLAGDYGSGNIDGIGTSARFTLISFITIDKADNIYVVDSDNIRKITPEGVVTTVTRAGFVTPWYIAVDEASNIYVYELTTGIIKRIATDGVITNYAARTNATYTNSNFDASGGMVADKQGNIFTVGAVNGLVYKINSSGISIVAGSTNGTAVDGIGTAARFSNLYGMSIDPLGNIYVINSTGKFIRKISTTYQVTTLPIVGEGHDFLGTLADKDGNVYFGKQTGSSQIRVLEPNGKVCVVAGKANGSSYVNGDQFTAQFENTAMLAMDRVGNIYVGDRASIRKITIKP